MFLPSMYNLISNILELMEDEYNIVATEPKMLKFL